MRKERVILNNIKAKLFRKCVDCSLVFELNDFAKDKTCTWGTSRKCKSCKKIRRNKTKQKYRSSEKGKITEKLYSEKYNEHNAEEIKERSRKYYNSKKGKEVAKAYKDSGKKKQSGTKYYKSEKGKIRSKKYYQDNKEEIDRKNKIYNETHPECNRNATKKYAEKNPHIKAKCKTNRRTKEKNSVPSWSEDDKIKQVYLGAKMLKDLTGMNYHVDHIIPLQHKSVCGLHVWANLQILEASLNLKKSNKFNGEL